MKIPYLYSITLMIALSVCTTKVLAQETATETKAEIVNNEMIGGEIRKIDKDAKKITIRHGEIKKFEMPPMTMVFQVKDEAFLNNIKTGDKVNFIAEKIGGAFVVTNNQVSN